jgi:hypothetical protein
MNKYEQLIEHIINDETDKARELFHNIVVEKSRDIYESLIDEQDLEEVGGNPVEELVDEVTIDEQGISEEEEGEEGDELALDSEEGEEVSADDQDEAEIEDRVVDLEDALDELKAEFDALMAGEEGEEHAEPGIHGDEEGEEEQSEFYEAEEAVEEAEEVDETIVREYVEKAPAPTTSEEGSTNKTTPVAGKNDMGGSAVNVTAGGATDPNGTSPKATAKPKGELIGKNLATPGANAGKAFAKKESAVKKEEGAVNKTTPTAK